MATKKVAKTTTKQTVKKAAKKVLTRKSLQEVKTSTPISSIHYAGFIVRTAATVIDTVVITLLWFVAAITVILSFLAPALGWIYLVLSDVKMNGQTFGKKAFGIRVVADNSSSISWGTALMREVVGKFLAGLIFGLGYLWVIWDPEKQGWHDKIAGTHVVYATPMSGARKVFAWLLFLLAVIGPVVAAIALMMGLLSIGNYLSRNPEVIKELRQSEQNREKIDSLLEELKRQQEEASETGDISY